MFYKFKIALPVMLANTEKKGGYTVPEHSCNMYSMCIYSSK